MKLWAKLLIVFVGCGLQGGLTYLTVQIPAWATVFGGLTIAVSGTMFILTGFPPKDQA